MHVNMVTLTATSLLAGFRRALTWPRLKEAVARFDCRTHERIQMGDHLVIVGEVTGFEATDGDSLLFHRGRYGSSEGLI